MTKQFGLPERVTEWEISECAFPSTYPIVAMCAEGAVVIYGRYIIVSTPGTELTQDERGNVIEWMARNTSSYFTFPVLFTKFRRSEMK